MDTSMAIVESRNPSSVWIQFESAGVVPITDSAADLGDYLARYYIRED